MSQCCKPLSITVAEAFSCPDNVSDVLTAASPRSPTAEIDRGNNPHYCVRVTHDFDRNDLVYVDVGEPGFGGALDTLLYISVQGHATGGTTSTIVHAGKNWQIDCWNGKVVCILSGPNAGQELNITDSTADTLEVWPVQPLAFDATTEYSIIADYDDDSGPGANSRLHYTVPTDETYIFEGTPYGAGVTGAIEMDFTCPLQAAFAHVPNCGTEMLVTNVAFNDQSLGHPTSWEWDFGDGTPHETVQNPTHIFPNQDVTTYPAMCGSRTVVLTARRGALVSTATDNIDVRKKIRIKNYLASFFTLGADAAACSDTGIADWDGVMIPSCSPGLPHLGCAWWANNVNVMGKLVTVGVYRADNGFCMPGQPAPPFGPLGFVFAILCGGAANWMQGQQYDYSTTPLGSNDPSGVYTLRTVLNCGACSHQDYLSAPNTLEIEYVP